MLVINYFVILYGSFLEFFCLVQSGKSAAIYACAKEQGFEVIEVL